MSAAGFARQAREFFRDRWQVPVALLAAVTASVALYRLLPRSTPGGLPELLAEVTAMEEDGDSIGAADALANRLRMDPPLPAAQQARLHDHLAGVIYRQERQREAPNHRNLRVLLNHHDAAEQLGCAPSAQRGLRAAEAAEWLGAAARAIDSYRAVLELDPAPLERRCALRGLIRLLPEEPTARAERQELLQQLLADEGESLEELCGALRQAVEIALDEDDTRRARALLDDHAQQLKTSDLKGYWNYLCAAVLVHEGRPAEAEPLIRWIEEWLDQPGAALAPPPAFGHLPTMNRCLLGELHLLEHRPQQALAVFQEALALAPREELHIPTLAGRARALMQLERHEAARDLLRGTVERLASAPAEAQRGAGQLRRTLLSLFEQRRAIQDYTNALEYLALATELTPPAQPEERLKLLDKLALTNQEAAEACRDPKLQQPYWVQAASYQEAAADLCTAEPEQQDALLWSAARCYDRAGRFSDARRMLLRFVEGRLEDARLPRAFLQLGRSFEADGQFEQARAWYQRLQEEFPKLEEAFRAKLHSARCLLALGRGDEAERTLRKLLEDDNITPQALVFHDALLELCDLLYQQGRYAEAISRLEDFATRYPDDPESFRSRFLLADAYRRSAYALQASAATGTEAARRQATGQERFRRAADLFAALDAELADEPEKDQARRLYARFALLYQADCLFELNRADTLQAALEIYQQAAARYEQEPAALTAQIQIANIHLRMGRPTEAIRAVERARWLLRNIPDSAFAAYDVGGDHQHWQRYLNVVLSSSLARDALAGGP